ncbi:hypothetical protein KP509_39G022700 [Ceratopteris richardii]|nr:hypothetical protein KP509_39G022700 [Ceratopteris richardii]
MASGVAAPPPLNAMPSLLHPNEEVTASPITQTASVSNSVYPSTLWECLPRIKISEIIPEDGAPSVEYLKSIDALWDCLTTHGAAVLETCPEDAALLRCALESAKIHFRTNHNRSISPPGLSQTMSQFMGYIGSSSKEMYYYRAGRNVSGEGDHPPCMSDVYRYLGRASRAALAAICRHLHLRSDAFWSLLDDCPLPRNEISSSVLLATHFRDSIPDGGSAQTVKYHEEFEMGFITLIASDSPGFQVLNSNGSWYVADIGLRAGDLLLVTGKALEHVTTGLCKAHAHRVIPFSSSSVPGFSKRVSLTFCLMPRDTAILDGSAMAEAGHVSSAG